MIWIRVTTYKYWIFGTLTNNVNEAAYVAALINSVGSVGSTMGFVIGKMNFSLVGACAINLVLFFVSMPGLFWVVWTQVTETSHGTSLVGYVPGQDVEGHGLGSGEDSPVEHVRELPEKSVTKKTVV